MWDIYFNVFGPLALGWLIFVGATMYLAEQLDPPAGVAFQNSLGNCFKKYFDFDGKADQSEFWYFIIWGIAAALWAQVVDNWSDLSELVTGQSYSSFWDPWILNILADVVLLFPTLAVGARRLHSVGKSGWWQLLMLTGIGLIYLIYLWAQPADKFKGSASKRSYRTKKDVSDELKELNQLYKDKAITKDEFSKAKKKLLD